MAKCLVELGCPAGKVRVQHLGIQIDEIPFRPRQWQPREPLRVLIAATFREKKGIPIALEMLGRLQHEVPLEITIVGEATSERRSKSERKTILETLARHNLGERVRMLGFQPREALMREAYRHHIFLSPSVVASDGDTEGGAPVSIIEMIASGMPVISSTHCDIPEVMRPESSRFLAPERDTDGLLHIARTMLSNWSALRGPLNNLRVHVEREYDSKTQATHLRHIYRETANH
jgi:colanic acid/amylovoran biosynthesis glycosyltransferase